MNKKKKPPTIVYISPNVPAFLRVRLTEACTYAGGNITEVPAAYMKELVMDSLLDKKTDTEGCTMNITLEKYPQFALAHELLKEFEGAVIAGGLTRDLLTGKEYNDNDIDIFMPIHSKAYLVELSLKAAKFAHQRNLIIEPLTYFLFEDEIVIRLRIGENIDLCFIEGYHNEFKDAKQPPKSLFDYFDFVCCQAWMERTEEGFIAHSTELFKTLNDRKILGFYPDRSYLNFNHAVNLLPKYADYLKLELVRPQETIEIESNNDYSF